MSSSAKSNEANFRIALSRDAANYYQKLDNKTAKRINIALETIAKEPFRAEGVRPIRTIPGRYRYRVGKLRIIFGVDSHERIVKVFAIVTRGKAYRKKK